MMLSRDLIINLIAEEIGFSILDLGNLPDTLLFQIGAIITGKAGYRCICGRGQVCDVCVMFVVLREATASIPSMVILLFSILDAENLVKHTVYGHSANLTSDLFVHRWVLNVNRRALNEIHSKHISPFLVDGAVKSFCWKKLRREYGCQQSAHVDGVRGPVFRSCKSELRVDLDIKQLNKRNRFASPQLQFITGEVENLQTEYLDSDKYIQKLQHTSTYDNDMYNSTVIYIYIIYHISYIYHMYMVYIYMMYVYIHTYMFTCTHPIIFLFTSIFASVLQPRHADIVGHWFLHSYDQPGNLEKWSRAGLGVGREVVVEKIPQRCWQENCDWFRGKP